jgi:hypothetical protein
VGVLLEEAGPQDPMAHPDRAGMVHRQGVATGALEDSVLLGHEAPCRMAIDSVSSYTRKSSLKLRASASNRVA